MENKTHNYTRFIFIFFVCLAFFTIIFSGIRLLLVHHEDLKSELPSTRKLLPEDSLLFSSNSIKKIRVLTTWLSKNGNQLSITTVESKYCLLIHRLDLANGFFLQTAIKFNDLNMTPTDLVTYRIFNIAGTADINFGLRSLKPTSIIFFSVSGDSIKKSIERDSIESYHVLCRNLYFGFTSKDTVDLYLTSNPTSENENKLPTDILFWKKEKSLYLLIMFPIESGNSIDDDEILKILKIESPLDFHRKFKN